MGVWILAVHSLSWGLEDIVLMLSGAPTALHLAVTKLGEHSPFPAGAWGMSFFLFVFYAS